MPGKVNPVICESLLMVCAQVIGNDSAIAFSGTQGNFEINLMMPLVAYNLIHSIELLASVSSNLALQCVRGITATERGPEMVERGLAMGTALAPIIGYDAAATDCQGSRSRPATTIYAYWSALRARRTSAQRSSTSSSIRS